MLIEVFVIKVDVEIVRLGIQYDGSETFPTGLYNGIISTAVEKEMIDLVKEAYDCSNSFFVSLEESVLDGSFARRIRKYMRQRDKSISPAGFRDFGEVSN